MSPELTKRDLVFCSVNKDIDMKIIPLMVFREKEGATLIIKKEQADEYGLEYDGIWDMITLNVNSDLKSIGFLAKITDSLAKESISVNPVSAYYHDHLFVLQEKSKDALKILQDLSHSEK